MTAFNFNKLDKRTIATILAVSVLDRKSIKDTIDAILDSLDRQDIPFGEEDKNDVEDINILRGELKVINALISRLRSSLQSIKY